MNWTRSNFWLFLLAAATLIGLLEGAQVYAGAAAMGAPVTWPRAIGSTMPSWYVLLALLPGILWMSRRFRLVPGRLATSIPVHLPVATAFAVLHMGGSSWLSDLLLFPDRPWDVAENLSRLFTFYFVVFLCIILPFFRVVVTKFMPKW